MQISKLKYSLILFFVSVLSYAEAPPPPTNPNGGGSDTGTQGPGAQASPIDMYVYILGIVAILFIVHFAKKYRAQKSLN